MTITAPPVLDPLDDLLVDGDGIPHITWSRNGWERITRCRRVARQRDGWWRAAAGRLQPADIPAWRLCHACRNAEETT